MLQLKVKPGAGYLKTVYYKMAKCGHDLEFNYTTPYICQDANCSEKPEQIDRLIGEHGMAARVKYFAEGKIG